MKVFIFVLQQETITKALQRTTNSIFYVCCLNKDKIKWKREIMHPRPEKGEPSRCKTCLRKENNYHCAETSMFSSL